MAPPLFRPNRSGMDKALDLVEETLAALRERAESQVYPVNQGMKITGGNKHKLDDAETSPDSILQESLGSKGKAVDTSVLIKRRPNRHHNNSKRKQSEEKNYNPKCKNSHITAAEPSASALRDLSHFHKGSGNLSAAGNHQTAIIHCSASHPSRLRSRKQNRRGSVILDNDSTNTSVPDRCRDSLSSVAFEVLRENYSTRPKMDKTEMSSTWVPPLSQSSPRELQSTRSRPTSKTVRESSIPSSLLDEIPVSKVSRVDAMQSTKSSLPLSSQKYSEPTLSSKLRVTLSQQKEQDTKENVISFIPSGSSNKSHHVGVIVQQKLGNLKHIPYKKKSCVAEPLMPRCVKSNEKDNSSFPTEEVIKKALCNIQKHINTVAEYT